MAAGFGLILALMALADREGSVSAPPEAAALPARSSAQASKRAVQPVKVHRGAPDAPAISTFAFAGTGDGLRLTGVPGLAVDELVYVEAGRSDTGAVSAVAPRVVTTTARDTELRFASV